MAQVVRFVSGRTRHTSTLWVHCLPVCFWVQCKVLVLTFKALRGMALSCLGEPSLSNFMFPSMCKEGMLWVQLTMKLHFAGPQQWVFSAMELILWNLLPRGKIGLITFLKKLVLALQYILEKLISNRKQFKKKKPHSCGLPFYICLQALLNSLLILIYLHWYKMYWQLLCLCLSVCTASDLNGLFVKSCPSENFTSMHYDDYIVTTAKHFWSMKWHSKVQLLYLGFFKQNCMALFCLGFFHVLARTILK